MTAGTAPPVTQRRSRRWRCPSPRPSGARHRRRATAGGPALAETLTVQSTYEIFRNSAAAFGDRTALTFLKTADPDGDTVSWSYRELLAGIHQTANLLHSLGWARATPSASCCPAAWNTTWRYGAARRPARCSR